jgi:outer membrane protein assembly factor BamB
VVGDKLFLGSGPTDLLCLDKESGKIQWMHTGTYWDAMADEERAAVKATSEPLLKELDECNAEIISLLNANISPQGLDTIQQAQIDQKLEERQKLARSVHNALASGRKGRLYLNEVSAGNATPTSDGTRVYWVVQGSGGYLTLALDLNGELIWSNFEYQNGAGEHGSHRSPLLCDGRLLVSTNEELIAYDALTGKELWRTPGSPHGHGINGTPIVVQIDGRRALQTTKNLVSLDGEVLSNRGFTTWGCYVPVVEDNVLYNPCTRRHEWAFEAIAVPGKAGANWKLTAKALYGPLVSTTAFFYNASPLYVDGLIYQVDMSGILVVVDTRERKPVYRHWMDGYNYNDRRLYGYCASPTLAGNNIYLLDQVGYATILQPGAEGTVLGNNALQNISNLPGSAPCKQEVFYAGMYFDDKKMFLHGNEYLYCIEEK